MMSTRSSDQVSSVATFPDVKKIAEVRADFSTVPILSEVSSPQMYLWLPSTLIVTSAPSTLTTTGAAAAAASRALAAA